MMDYINYIIMTVIGAITSAITWLVRTVLTNQKKIALLEAEIKSRDQRRDEDRQFWLDMRADFKSEINEVKEDINEVKAEMLELWKQK